MQQSQLPTSFSSLAKDVLVMLRCEADVSPSSSSIKASTMSVDHNESVEAVGGVDQEGLSSCVDNMSPCDTIRKRTRRGGAKKNFRRKKPYDSMTSEEKERMDRRNYEKAERQYVRHFREGRPMAPLNSTQFIIADHGAVTPQIVKSPSRHERSLLLSDSSVSEAESDDDMVPGEVGKDFFERDFAEAYSEYNLSLLNSYDKDKLVQTCVELQSRVEELEKSLEESERLCEGLRRLNADLKASNKDAMLRLSGQSFHDQETDADEDTDDTDQNYSEASDPPE